MTSKKCCDIIPLAFVSKQFRFSRVNWRESRNGSNRSIEKTKRKRGKKVRKKIDEENQSSGAVDEKRKKGSGDSTL